MTARWLPLAVLAALLPLAALAGTRRVVEAADGAVVRVSAAEPNLLEAKSGRISAFVFSEGKFIETIDDAAGVVYFQPLDDGPRSGFVEVVDAQGTRTRFGLVLVPDLDWPAQRIVLQATLVAPATPPPPADLPPVPRTATPHVAAVKDLLRAMLAGTATPVASGTASRRLELDGLVLTRLASFRAAGLTGELHRLENVTAEPRRFDEARLYVADDILAVTTPATALEPGTATEVYLVRTAPATGGRP